MRYVIIGAAATMALLGTTTLANAQAPDDKSKAPAAERKGPASEGKGTQREPGAGKSEQSQQPPPGAGPKAERRDERSGKDQPRATERQQPGTKGSARVQVSEQQRHSVGDRLRQGRVETTRINVNVNIGSTLPRSVRLRTLPVAIIELAPAYRSHSYVLEDETILIVDAQTYVIVDVIPAGTQHAGRPGGAQLALSADQMRFIFTRVPKDRKADVRVRLALGAEAPRASSCWHSPAW